MRPKVLSIAGFDPSGGAGILSDIKTFEQFKCLGQGACTAITFQNESRFEGMRWITSDEIKKQITPIVHDIAATKIGLIESPAQVSDLLPNGPLVWDPVLSASAGFQFETNLDLADLRTLLDKLTLITPNKAEYETLMNIVDLHSHTNVLLKGGHNDNDANDILYTSDQNHTLSGDRLTGSGKHGTGCILSSAITASLALNESLLTACANAKAYTTKRIASNDSLLAYHHE